MNAFVATHWAAAAAGIRGVPGMILGLAAGFVCCYFCATTKNKFGDDDSWDASGVGERWRLEFVAESLFNDKGDS